MKDVLLQVQAGFDPATSKLGVTGLTHWGVQHRSPKKKKTKIERRKKGLRFFTQTHKPLNHLPHNLKKRLFKLYFLSLQFVFICSLMYCKNSEKKLPESLKPTSSPLDCLQCRWPKK